MKKRAALALALATVVGCGADDAARPHVLPPVTSVPTHARADAQPQPVSTDASVDALSATDAARARETPALPPPRVTVPEPAFGAGSVKPGDPQPFRFSVALRAMRLNASGAKIARMLSAIPEIIEVKRKTSVDPFADGEWLLVYGSKVELPGPNANIVRHAKTDAEVAKAITASGASGVDGGAQMLGVRDVLIRPQPGVLAFVPEDRAKDLAVALVKPIDPGVKPGELLRIFLAEPAKSLRFLPAEIVRANVVVKSAADGGLDASAEADCLDVAMCAATATALDELVTRQNSIMVRIALRNLLGGVAVRADGTKLKATLHALPEQVDAAVNLIGAQLGLPPPAPP